MVLPSCTSIYALDEMDAGVMGGAGAVAGARRVECWVLTERARGAAPRTAHRMECDVKDTHT